MADESKRLAQEPTREEVDLMAGPLLLDFGASWCPICQAFAPQLTVLLKKFPALTHLRIEDGKGKRLGRSFRVKLWPNLVFLKDGKAIEQLARPSVAETEAALAKLFEARSSAPKASE